MATLNPNIPYSGSSYEMGPSPSNQPLTDAELQQARAWMAAQYGPDWMSRFQTPSANQAAGNGANDPSAAYNSATGGMLYDMMGAGQAVGYGNDALGQISGMGQGYFDRLTTGMDPYAQDLIAANGRGFVGQTGVGNIDNVQDQYLTQRNPDGSYVTTQRSGGGQWDPASQDWVYEAEDPNRGQNGGGRGSRGAVQGQNGAGATGATGNPYLDSIAGTITQRLNENYERGLVPIGDAAISAGGLGGSRQGVAQGIALEGTQDALASALAGLYGGAYESDQNRGVQRYGIDQSYNLGMTNAANNRYATEGAQNLGNQNSWMNFYTNQRGQDLSQLGLGAQLYQSGLTGEWNPLNQASGIYNTASGNTVNVNSGGQTGGGWQGILGGALTGASLGNRMGWWG